MQSYSQTFGIRAGLNLATFASTKDLTMTPGFHLGPSYEYQFSDVFSLESALLLSTTGANSSLHFSEFNQSISEKLEVYNLNNSIMAKGTFKVGKYTNVYTQAGPYIAMAMFGSANTEEKVDGQTNKNREALDWEDLDENRFDIGLTFGAGVQWRAFQIGVGYDLGLIEGVLIADEDYKNRVFKVSLGYNFGS